MKCWSHFLLVTLMCSTRSTASIAAPLATAAQRTTFDHELKSVRPTSCVNARLLSIRGGKFIPKVRHDEWIFFVVAHTSTLKEKQSIESNKRFAQWRQTSDKSFFAVFALLYVYTCFGFACTGYIRSRCQQNFRNLATFDVSYLSWSPEHVNGK